jgi:hypothetical protein
VVGVDPGVDAGRRLEFGPRRAQFDGDDVLRRLEVGEDYLRSLSL